MKIKNISKIENYKSYVNFNLENSIFHENLNLFFGENGNGKSALVDIFKNLSDNKEFEKKPKKILLKIDDKEYAFSEENWDEKINKKDFIFFDDDFIAKNIHTNKERNNTQEGQAQNSSNLFISVDETAIELKKSEEKEKKKLKELKKENKELKKENNELLKKDFEKFEYEIRSFKDENLKKEKNLENLENLKKEKLVEKNLLNNKNKIEKIQNLKLEDIQNKEEITLSGFEENLNKLKKIDVKERTVEKSKFNLAIYIKNNKDFFEEGFKLREKQEDKRCPFCLTKTKETEIEDFLKLKNEIFDEAYKRELKIFDNLKNEILNFLSELEDKTFSFQEFFDKLEKINNDFPIENFYIIEEKKKFKEFKFRNLKKFKEELKNLNEKNNKNFQFENLENFKNEIKNLNEIIKKLNRLIKEKNISLEEFKKENSNEKIIDNLKIIKEKIEKLNAKKEFFENFYEIKRFFKITLKIKNKNIDIEVQKNKHKNSKNNIHNYLSKDIFKNKVKKISEYLEKFNLNFKLEFKKTEGTHEIMPFVFSIRDKDKNIRSIEDGISNGELQAISISFFLSFLDSQNLNNKIIFFDDPISSLDNSNLKNFVDLLNEKKIIKKNISEDNISEKNLIENNQIFIFTHHLTFFKFLSKKFKKNSEEFLILKNKSQFGGSFYCEFFKKNLFNKLENFEKDKIEIIKNNNKYDYETKIIEYGQILRYEVEKFIKNDLLSWNKSHNFSQIVDGLKTNAIDNTDFDKIKKIYNFCNWTNSHADIGESYSLNDLENNIENFVEIKSKHIKKIKTKNNKKLN
jgi:energy-coupling factor transporter ATP-binding protein EcfA2